MSQMRLDPSRGRKSPSNSPLHQYQLRKRATIGLGHSSPANVSCARRAVAIEPPSASAMTRPDTASIAPASGSVALLFSSLANFPGQCEAKRKNLSSSLATQLATKDQWLRTTPSRTCTSTLVALKAPLSPYDVF